ncbi:MAG TPA: serine/threonine-protein kinase [Phycisphaerales bacterium]|nr:serine/threonine-protein kinase [Phycisphaerales bacterium]
MSQAPQYNKPGDDPDVLRLEEESDGSTVHVGSETTGSATDPPAPPRRSPSGKPTPIDAVQTESTDGTSTGGFDTLLGKVVVETGLVTPEEMELCNSLLTESAGDSSEEPRTLADLLIENEFLTPRQLERVRSEFEARKSSQRIPGYKIIRKLGAGAMATVFLARQLSLDRDVAVKVLPKKFSDNKKFIERFYKEGRAAAQLNHPNIVGAYDVGQAGEHHYFVMEYVDGETVYDRVITHKRMPEAEAISIIKQCAQALKHAHEKGFIHRDIKPKNIMITKAGVVKLADLGLARAMSDMQAAKAEAGRAYGTPYYISPEQIRGEVNIGPPADIYGLGATFYHMVTGKLPFEGKNPSAVMHKHLKAELVPPDHVNPKLSAGCAQVIEMMMAKDKAARYQNAADLLEDLDLISRGQPPHFAHRGLSAAFTQSPVAAATHEAVQPTVVKPEGGGLFDTTSGIMMVLLLIASLIANALMIVVLLQR